ncbi:MAG: helix-turn-helix transcriptional regulator [Patescibacteria group bacterium]|jgi:DNA-binding PadR family transcriptional regulator
MQFSKEIIKGVAEIIVLQTLHEHGEAYGYQLTRAIAQTSQNIFELQEGTLYPLLYRLEFKNLVTSQVKPAPNGKDRRYYHITNKGKKLLLERTTELGILLKGIKQVLHLAI